MATEEEEFEFRLRMEQEARPQRRSPKYMSESDNPENVGLLKAMKSVEQGIYEAGGKVTDVASRMGASPGMAAGAGYLTNVGLNTLPMLFGGGAGKAATIPLQNVGKTLMQQAVKPTLGQLKSGEAATAIDTMLKEGINPTHGGVEKLHGMIEKLNQQIDAAIGSSVETVNKGKVGLSLKETFNKFKNQVNPRSDLEAIKNAWSEFRSHPDLIGKTEIPVQKAQELKKGTYRILRDKYGQLGSAEIEAQKGLARGLKEGIADKVPGISGLNAEEKKLIDTLNVAERRALMSLNNNIGSLGWLTTSPAKFAAYMADKSPLFKSLAARMIYSSAPAAPTIGRAGAVALSEIGQNMGP